jgi:hypothetical protein
MHAIDVHVCVSRQHLAQSPWRVAEEPIFADVDSERLRTLGVLNTHTHTHTHTRSLHVAAQQRAHATAALYRS